MPGPGRKATFIQIRVTAAQKTQFTKAASRMGLGVSAWLRSIALQASREDNGTKKK
jgi:antitoxin component of RelBE/YafQ-DinJ toxin-antitoxin module